MKNSANLVAQSIVVLWLISGRCVAADLNQKHPEQSPDAPTNAIPSRKAPVLTFYSSDGAFFAATSSEGKILYGRTADGAVLRTLYHCHAKAAAFSPDGAMLASAGESCSKMTTIKIWRLSNGQVIDRFTDETQSTPIMAFSANGRYFACASGRTAVSFWPVGRSDQQSFIQLRRPVKTLAFSPDGSTLIIQCADQSVKRISVGFELECLRDSVGGSPELVETPKLEKG